MGAAIVWLEVRTPTLTDMPLTGAVGRSTIWSDLNQNHQLALVIVASGMGGHAGGEQTVQLVLRTITTNLAPLLTGALNMQQREVTRAGLADPIDAAIKRANNAPEVRFADSFFHLTRG